MKSILFVWLIAKATLPAAPPIWGDQGDGTYRNPILWMDYNNPCVIRHGDSFYLTAATHHFNYILVARTGPHKAQFAYRSKSLYGPYESKLLFEDQTREIQAAQGSLVPVTANEWAFIHHDYRMESPYGRRTFLQPDGWRDG